MHFQNIYLMKFLKFYVKMLNQYLQILSETRYVLQTNQKEIIFKIIGMINKHEL